MKITLERAYETLGVSSGASEDEARVAYRKLALKFHPDKNPHEDATAKFQEISAAYKRICDFHKRGGNQGFRGSFFRGSDDSDGGESDDIDLDDVDLEDLELSFEEMLMMFEMMFGPTMPMPGKKSKSKINNKKKAATAPSVATSTATTGPGTGTTSSSSATGGKVSVPLGTGGRVGKTRRRKAPLHGKQRGGLFGGLDDPFEAFLDPEMMMFEQFMGMSMNDPELNDMEGDMMEEMMHLYAQSAGDDLFSSGRKGGGKGRKQQQRNQNKKPPMTTSSAEDGSEDEVEEVSDWEDEQEAGKATTTAIDPGNQSEPHSTPQPVTVGSRVVVYGKLRGTAKFVGPVHYTKGDFIGIDLDEPEGKNDGTLKGVAYFECQPRHGLMVRPQDVVLATEGE